jgi:hypothetical protein
MIDEAAANVDPMAAAMQHYSSIREDAAKAVEEAVQAEAGKEPAEPEADPEAPDEPAAAKKDAPPGEDKPESEPDLKSIAKILKSREKAAKEKTETQQIRAELDKLKAEIEADKTSLAREREAFLAEREGWKKKLKDIRHAPEALAEVGWDPEAFVLEAAKANTPEGKLAATVRDLQSKLDKLEGRANGWQEEAEKQKAEAQKRAEEQSVRAAEEAFQKIAVDAEKYPALVSLYDDDRDILVMKAHRVAREYREQTGDEATFEQIADYLHELALAKLESAKEQKAQKNGKALPAGRPPGKRTLTNADSSERRTVGPVDKTDDLDEMRRRARAAADKAIRESA